MLDGHAVSSTRTSTRYEIKGVLGRGGMGDLTTTAHAQAIQLRTNRQHCFDSATVEKHRFRWTSAGAVDVQGEHSRLDLSIARTFGAERIGMAKKKANRKTTKKDTEPSLSQGNVPLNPTTSPKKSKSASRTEKENATTAVNDSHLIVGLGASAGGLEALEEFFRHMPADSGMAFVVVTHQAAKHISLLPELLDKCTKMRVAAVEERMPVQPNHVYIAPPGKKVDLLAGTLHLSDLRNAPSLALCIW
jgi:chemotaxis response regulator CheB